MMRRLLKDLYGFLPVQLLLLHLRKYQLLLFFWVLLVMVITGHFASTFGAESLFLSPEYMGEINFGSMFLLGGALAMFTMSWHITTFIIHSKRVPFLGAARHAFLKYCINNSLLPLAFIIFYSITYARYQWVNEHSSALRIISLLSSFFGGSLTGFIISFAYFFRADRNILKIILSGITNPKLIREIIPYDSLDAEFDVLLARTFLTGRCRVQKISSLERYNMRVMETVLRRHHRNAVFATLVAIILLLLLGIFMNVPQVRIPAGAGFLILFSIMLGIVGAFKYFLRSWEVLGWCVAILLVSLLVHRKVIDFRSTATGINYQGPAGAVPQYDYQHLHQLYTPAKKEADRQNNLLILEQWKQRRAAEGDSLPPLVIICASGGGSRAAYWTFRALQYADSVSKGKLFRNTVLMTGASGGMIGSAYWRSIRWKYYRKELNSLYDPSFQQNVGKDMLNAIIFSFVSIDLVAPFNEVKIGNRSYRKDRGYAMEEELIRNTNGVLDSRISDFKQAEQKAEIPLMLLGNTIINDGRRLLVSAQPMAHMTQPVSQAISSMPVTDVVDLQSFFAAQSPGDLRLVSALRMNATFPYVLPVVKMPSQPAINIMDAGLRDNFGMESAMRFLTVFRDWIAANTRDVIILQVRDTREHELFRPEEQNSLLSMAVDPMVVIHNKWGTFQTYSQTYMKDLAFCGLEHKLHFINFEYIPEKEDRSAALNFHLTQKEKEDLYHSMTRQQNQDMADTLLRYLKP